MYSTAKINIASNIYNNNINNIHKKQYNKEKKKQLFEGYFDYFNNFITLMVPEKYNTFDKNIPWYVSIFHYFNILFLSIIFLVSFNNLGYNNKNIVFGIIFLINIIIILLIIIFHIFYSEMIIYLLISIFILDILTVCINFIIGIILFKISRLKELGELVLIFNIILALFLILKVMFFATKNYNHLYKCLNNIFNNDAKEHLESLQYFIDQYIIINQYQANFHISKEFLRSEYKYNGRIDYYQLFCDFFTYIFKYHLNDSNPKYKATANKIKIEWLKMGNNK